MSVQFLDDAGNPIDLTGASVWFVMWQVDVSPPVSKIDTTAGAANAVLRTPNTTGWADYTMLAADVNTPGDFSWEMQAKLASGSKVFFPRSGKGSIRISDTLAANVT